MIEYLVKKRKMVILIFSILILCGLFNFPTLNHQEMPDIKACSAMITTVYPGASPEKVELAVTKKIEEKLNEMPGIKTISSESRDNASIIIVEADNGVATDALWDALRKKIKDVEPELPSGTLTPVVNDELSKAFIQTFNVTADSYEQLYSLSSTLNSWKDQLYTIRNISGVTLIGLPEKEVIVDLYPGKLSEYAITWQQVANAIQTDNNKSPMGSVDTKEHTFKLELDESYSPEQLNNVLIAQTKDGKPIYLRDIGKASAGFKKPDYYVSQNGKPSISFTMIANLGSDVPAIQKEVDIKEASFREELPSWAKIENVYTKNDYLNELFHDLTREVIIAIAAVLLVCSLGLNFTTAVVIALAIPFSTLVALLFSQFFHMTLNEVSIYSIIIVIGILVDDAVVVNDNIDRHLCILHEPPEIAGIEGAKEVILPIITAVLAAFFSFGVLEFIPAEIGQIARPLPIVVILSMLTSMSMALTLVPIFRIWYEKRNRRKTYGSEKPAGLIGVPIRSLTDWYSQKILPKILKYPLIIGVLALVISMSAYSLILLTPIQLFPPANRSELLVDIRGASGTSIESTKDLVADVSKWVADQKGVEMVVSYAGGSAPDMFGDDKPIGIGAELGQLVVRLNKEKTTTASVVGPWYNELQERYPQAEITPRELILGVPVGKAVEVRIYGPDAATLNDLAQQVKERIKSVEGVRNIQDNVGADLCTFRLKVNKSLMDLKMINNTALTSTLLLASSGMTIGQFDDGEKMININLYSDKAKADPLQRIENLSVPNALGLQIPLRQIAQIETVYTPKTIQHRNLSREISVTSDLDGRSPLRAMPDVEKIMDQIDLPDGYHWEAGGEVAKEKEILGDLAKLLAIAVLLIIVTVAIQFNSLSKPFLVLLTFLLAFSGSFIGLFLTGSSFGFTGIMGIISLVGIVARNGIVLLEFIENERHQGIELKQAVINAVGSRMKPILLTSSTAIVGLTPIAVSSNVLFRPLAIAIIFGLMYSTLLMLVIVPAFYITIEELLMKKKKLTMDNQNQFHLS